MQILHKQSFDFIPKKDALQLKLIAILERGVTEIFFQYK
jgi:hypothetical protein